MGKDSCHPIELRRDLSHNGDLEVLPSVGEKCGRTNGGREGGQLPEPDSSRHPLNACVLNLAMKKTSTIKIGPCLHIVS